VSDEASLRAALESIHAARLRADGSDAGYGWNITKLNRAMDAALPLLGREAPIRPYIDVAALRKLGGTDRESENESEN
jgi:hypothetical protein